MSRSKEVLSATAKGLAGGGQRHHGLLGFISACAFLLFVNVFNERVQTYKAQRSIRRTAKTAGLRVTMSFILRTTCSIREATTVVKLSLMLLLRTMGSVWVTDHWGKITGALVTRSFKRMSRLVWQFGGATVGLAVLNALLKYYIAALKLEVREKITTWCHRMYMRPKDMTYYKVNKMGKEEDRVENCDHQITSDVERFSEVFAEVLSQSLKPIVDFLVYSVELSRVQGLLTPLTLYVWFALASCISTVTLPPFGELAATEQHLEGVFRASHSALKFHCEQIAFLGGEQPEQQVLDDQFYSLLRHCRRSVNLSFNSEVVRQYLNKYFVTVIGFFLIARPLRLGFNDMPSYTADQISRYFTSTWRKMEAMATSIQDLFELTNRIGTLSGLASRVQRLMVSLEAKPGVRPAYLADQIEAARRGPYPPIFKRGTYLKFEHVSVYKPDGTLLVKDLNFSVKKGQRVLITGTNGTGKSSLFRVIRKLWPLVEGTITMPPEKEIHFVTQANFVPKGTLRDLVIYPQSYEEMKASGKTDHDIRNCLRWAHVSPFVLNEDGQAQLEFTAGDRIVRPQLDDVRTWTQDLSPGQMQRVAFARLFYHQPSFIILDECTNGISPEVEHDLYDRCTRFNLAVFSISHKIELKLFHEYELHYNGDKEGSWSWRTCSERVGAVTRSESYVRLPDAQEEADFEEEERLLEEADRLSPIDQPGDHRVSSRLIRVASRERQRRESHLLYERRT